MIYHFSSNQRTYEVEIEKQGDRFFTQLNGQTYYFKILERTPDTYHLEIDGCLRQLTWVENNQQKWIAYQGQTYHLENPAGSDRSKHREIEGFNEVRAPMPALVRAVSVEPGDSVQKGQTLLLLEAMKMEIRITSPQPGRVENIAVQEGQTVNRDEVLFTIIPEK